MQNTRVFYVWDEDLIQQCDRLPAVMGRASITHSLITAYNLLDHFKVVRSKPATFMDLKDFHSELYLHHLKTFDEIDDEEYMSNAQDEEYGIGYDCPPVSNMFELVSTIAGGSITGARCLVLGMADVAINWCGGWHHAQRFRADGFCYVNDIVLAIETLKQKFPKVLYVDLDVHHGNGVQDAYNLSKSVFTLSLHKFEPGFYPGTGEVADIGTLDGKGYSCNVPLHAAYSDETFKYVFDIIFITIIKLFVPDAIVVQCGADALAHDPYGGANLTVEGYSSCIRRILDQRKPTLMLGGGGYNDQNAARLWTSLTALISGVTLDGNIPEHSHWPKYGPDFMLAVKPSLARDTNKKNYLEDCLASVIGNLNKYLKKPSNTSAPDIKRRKTDSENDDCKQGNYSKENITNKNSKYQTLSKLVLNTDVSEPKLTDLKDNTSDNIDVYEFTDI